MTDYVRFDRPPDTAPMRLALIAFASAFFSTALGLAIGNRFLLPLLNTAAIYPFYLELVLQGRRRRAVALALLWAVFLSQAMVAGTLLAPERARKTTLMGAEYADEMFQWVRTGEGAESSPRRFIPAHLKTFALFVVLSAATAGFGGLLMGAVLLNYMNFYVGSLVLAARRPVLTLLFAWQPYAAIRVIAYIILATVLCEVLFSLVGRRRLRVRGLKRYAAAGIAGVILDVLVKSALAPLWSGILKWTTGL
jgi:hypothetical protein